MASYVRKPTPAKATQWFRHGDSDLVYKLSENYFNINYVCDCGHPFSSHGITIGKEICPGDWVIFEYDFRTSVEPCVCKQKDFETYFQEVKMSNQEDFKSVESVASIRRIQFLCSALVIVFGMTGLYLEIPYSGWVLFVGLLSLIG